MRRRSGPAFTRRQLLAGAGGLAATAAFGRPVSAGPRPDGLVERAVIVFPDYAGWALARPARMPTFARRVNARPDILVVSDASPSVFADLGCLALVRPAMLEVSPLAILADLTRREGELVVSAHSIGKPAEGRRPDGGPPWERLAELTWLLGPRTGVLVDLGGRVRETDAIRAGMQALREAYARYSEGDIDVSCQCGSPA